MLFNQMVEKEKTLTVLLGHIVTKAERDDALIKNVTLKPMHGERTSKSAGKVFADGMYEGDLIAAAGVKSQIGRESRAQYGEEHAGVIYTQERHKEPGQRGFPKGRRRRDAEHSLQQPCHSRHRRRPAERRGRQLRDGLHNYRLILTRDPANRILVSKPAKYDSAIAKQAIGGGFVRICRTTKSHGMADASLDAAERISRCRLV